jgi:hypothetical protein
MTIAKRGIVVSIEHMERGPTVKLPTGASWLLILHTPSREVDAHPLAEPVAPPIHVKGSWQPHELSDPSRGQVEFEAKAEQQPITRIEVFQGSFQQAMQVLRADPRVGGFRVRRRQGLDVDLVGE